MTAGTKLAADFVKSLVRVENDILVWQARPTELFRCTALCANWNDRFANKPVGTRALSNGYLTLRFAGHTLLVHRVVWLLSFGDWPTGELDHIDGNKLNNWIDNLRDVDKSGNMRNQRVRRDSTSGFPGVHFCPDKRSKPWAARIGINRKWHLLGYFATKEEAIACRKREQAKYGFSARHGCADPTSEQAAA